MRWRSPLNVREEPPILWLGRCPACHTSVLADDDFVRAERKVYHHECRARSERRAGGRLVRSFASLRLRSQPED